MWLASGSAIAHRSSSGRRCRAEARLSRTFGLGSVLASSRESRHRGRRRRARIAEQPDSPRPDVLAGLIEQGKGGLLVEAAAHVQGPDGPQPAGHVGVFRQDLAQQTMGLAQVPPGGRAFLKQPPGRAHIPVVVVKLQLRQGFRRPGRPGRPSPASAVP